MLVLARMFEERGLSTILVTMMPSWAEQYGGSRAMAVEFPFGHPLGLPGHHMMQTMVIKDALRVMEQATEPNTFIHAEYCWPGDESYWRKAWQPAAASPLVAKYLHEIRAMRP